MKCTILHESAGRLRVHLCCARMTLHQADVLEYYLRAQGGVRSVKVYDPWVERDEVPGQVHSMEEFLDGLEMVIVMVGLSQVKDNPGIFGDRVLIDPRNVCGEGENVYKL